jgi:hypothetical protein
VTVWKLRRVRSIFLWVEAARGSPRGVRSYAVALFRIILAMLAVIGIAQCAKKKLLSVPALWNSHGTVAGMAVVLRSNTDVMGSSAGSQAFFSAGFA